MARKKARIYRSLGLAGELRRSTRMLSKMSRLLRYYAHAQWISPDDDEEGLLPLLKAARGTAAIRKEEAIRAEKMEKSLPIVLEELERLKKRAEAGEKNPEVVIRSLNRVLFHIRSFQA